MFILEEPYVSDLLATTVAELGLPVLDTPMARRRLDRVARRASLGRRRVRRSGLAAGRAALLELGERHRLDRRAPRRARTCRA